MTTFLPTLYIQQLSMQSRLCGIWGDSIVSSFTLASISTYKEADSNRSIKNILRKHFVFEKLLIQ